MAFANQLGRRLSLMIVSIFAAPYMSCSFGPVLDMSSLDSKAAFKARADELELDGGVYQKLLTAKVDTFGALAFIGPLQAGNSDEQCLIDMLKSALGADPSAPVLRVMRRLWFEATTQTLSEMKGKIERTDASEPVRMPLAERTQRVAALQKRLVGVHWTIDIEPSHRLQDQVAQMVSDQALLWVPWDRLTSRAMEITAEKSDSMVQFDSSGVLKVVKKQPDATCSGTGEYAVRLALQRRSLAFELGRLCRYEYMESWHEMILQIHMRVQPPGLQRVSMSQLREADKVLFTNIAEETRGALSIRPDGTYPFELSLAKWKDHTQVQYHLVPVAAGRASDSTKDPENKRKTPTTPNPEAKKKLKKNDEKKPDKEKESKNWQIPEGCHSRDKSGKPICYAHNQRGCTFAKPGNDAGEVAIFVGVAWARTTLRSSALSFSEPSQGAMQL